MSLQIVQNLYTACKRQKYVNEILTCAVLYKQEYIQNRLSHNIFSHLSVHGQAAGCAHPTSPCLQGDVFCGWPLLDVQDSNSSLPSWRSNVPGLTARHPPRSTFRSPGVHGRFLCNPTPLCVHLYHVQRGGHTETERLGAQRRTQHLRRTCKSSINA